MAGKHTRRHPAFIEIGKGRETAVRLRAPRRPAEYEGRNAYCSGEAMPEQGQGCGGYGFRTVSLSVTGASPALTLAGFSPTGTPGTGKTVQRGLGGNAESRRRTDAQPTMSAAVAVPKRGSANGVQTVINVNDNPTNWNVNGDNGNNENVLKTDTRVVCVP